ncbi:MAG: hypothetical protein L7F77_02125, partial [Candidatus Magnetominusculus sp. LBB02]|nr:hypothetical protein [Candidatus Magnetominusculus sp. LBB02]
MKRVLNPLRAARSEKIAYRKWILANEPDSNALSSERVCKVGPCFAVVCAGTIQQTSLLIASLGEQTYGRWRLYLICDVDKDALEHETDIALIDNSLPPAEIAAMLDGDFIVSVGKNTALCPFALYEIAASINANAAGELFYSDEDTLLKGRRVAPHFKPDCSPDMLMSFNYIGPLLVVKRSLYVSDPMAAIENRYALALKYFKDKRTVIHIPKVLFHNVGSARQDNFAAETLAAHLADCAIAANIEERPPGMFNIIYGINGSPRISII